jgi:2-polyprenyl-6-methoxyphenol hydroxylase-like FAD-dependent oxidoreductase
VRDTSILIAGAGLAGLAMARALQNRDQAFDIVERAPEAAAAGAGIFLPGNAVRALTRLGVTGAGHPITRHRVLTHRGGRLIDMPFRDIWGDAECRAVRRAELHAALGKGVEVQHGVVAGTQGYALTVAADGIRSIFRTGPAPRPVGLMAWRFLATGLPDEHSWTAWQGPDRTFLAIALGGGHAYCYADATRMPPGDWRELFAGFADPVPALVAQGQDAHWAAIEEVGPAFSDDPGVVLIGDAAHAFSPNMAQGAALAFEDALVLAELIDTDRVADFRARRESRIAWVRDHTHQRDRARHLPPMVRNTVLRVAGTRMVKAQFRALRA